MRAIHLFICAVIVVLLFSSSVDALGQTSFTWTGSAGDNDWSNSANWSPPGVPGTAPGDAATIETGHTVTLLGPISQPLEFLHVGLKSTLRLTGGDWALRVTEGTGEILLGTSLGWGKMVIADDPNAAGPIEIRANRLRLGSNGFIDANGNGYPGGAAGVAGDGPGGGTAGSTTEEGGAGGGHGGNGGSGDGSTSGGTANGSISSPTTPGSGGGGSSSDSGVGGNGGGRIRLIIQNELIVLGTIRADGSKPEIVGGQGAGGGAGGSIWITSGTVTGAGMVTANGGDGRFGGTKDRDAGAGAGGRIAIDGYTGSIGPTLSAIGGFPEAVTPQDGAAGTIFLQPSGQSSPDVRMDNERIESGAGETPFPTSISSLESLTLGTGVTLEIPASLTVESGDVEVRSGTTVYLTGAAWNLTLSSLLDVFDGGRLVFDDDDGNGDGISIVVPDIRIRAGGLIEANGTGGAGGAPGAGGSGDGGGAGAASSTEGGAGGGHGGAGGFGDGNVEGGAGHGSMVQPDSIGGGGGGNSTDTGTGGNGGGRIRLSVSGTMTIDGEIEANGDAGALVGGQGSGGGAGGSIWISAATIAGGGTVRANGGAGRFGGADSRDAGGGGGGRIAIDSYSGSLGWTLEAFGGEPQATTPQAGGAGTIYVAPTDQSRPSVYIANSLANSGAAETKFDPAVSLLNDFLIGSGATISISDALDISGSDTTLGQGTWMTLKGGGWSLDLSGTFTVGANSALIFDDDNGSTDAISMTAAALIVESGGSIHADATGYPGGAVGADGSGTGGGEGAQAGTSGGGGGGHGGVGGQGDGQSLGGTAYGSVGQPQSLGSGGGGNQVDVGVGGAGGGRVRISVSGTLTLDGVISANGETAAISEQGVGGGAGGSIWLSIGDASGSGFVQANGGEGRFGGSVARDGGGGGGGRIAVDGFTGTLPWTLEAFGGEPQATTPQAGGAGTILLQAAGASTPSLFVDNNSISGAATFLPDGDYSFDQMDVTGSAVFVESPDTSFEVGDLLIDATWTHESGVAPGVGLVAQDLTIGTNGVIDASGLGYLGSAGDGNGPGGGIASGGATEAGGGGGYGAAGGDGAGTTETGGQAYGSEIGPVDPGSAGGGNSTDGTEGGAGGGSILLDVSGTLTHNGIIRADGADGGAGSGGGAGGSIWIAAGAVSGSGSVSAIGGDSSTGGVTGLLGGGGGGGRILIATDASTIAWTTDVSGGSGATAGINGFVDTLTNARIELDSPAHLGENVDGSSGITLDWSGFSLPAGASYSIELDDDPFFAEGQVGQPQGYVETGQPIEIQTGLTSATYDSSNLIPGARYFWHIIVRDNTNNVIGVSPMYSFLARDFQLPTAPSGLEQEHASTGQVVSVGDWVDSTSIVLRAVSGDPDPADVFRLQFEVRPVTDAFTSPSTVTIDNAVFFESSDSSSNDSEALDAALTGLTPGEEYHWQVRSIDSEGTASVWIAFPQPPNVDNPPTNPADTDFGVDTTGPVAGTVFDGNGEVEEDAQTSTTTIDADWFGFTDPESGISGYAWAIGTSAGGTDVQDFTSVGTSTFGNATGLSLVNGQIYFVTVRATNGAGATVDVSTDGVLVDNTAPVAGSVNDGTGSDIDDQVSSSVIDGNWSGFSDPEGSIVGYRWAIGTTPGAVDVLGFSSVGTSTSAQVTGLQLADGTTVYITIEATNDAGLTVSTTSDGLRVDTSGPIAGQVFDGQGQDIDVQFSTSSLTANWAGFDDPESGIAGYEWAIGTGAAPESVQAFTAAGTTTLATANSISLTNGVTYFVTVRGYNAAGQTVTAVSDGVVPDPNAPSVTLLTPNGGEAFVVGDLTSITWSSSSVLGITGIDVLYSTDGGATYPNTIANGIADTGSTSWTIPNDASGSVRVRVVATDAGANVVDDDSDANLSIEDPLQVDTASLGDAVVGTEYTPVLSASGGDGAHTWQVVSGSLPPGVALDSGTGAFSGQPASGGTFNFTVEVADSHTSPHTDSQALSIQVLSELTIATSSLPDALTTTNYDETLVVTGGTTPYQFTLLSGVLPNGLVLDGNTGQISGLATQTGSFPLVVQVTDSTVTGPAVDTVSLTLDVFAIGQVQNVSVTTSSGQIQISWSPVAGAASYRVYYGSSGPSSLDGTDAAEGVSPLAGVVTTGQTLTGLTDRIVYYLQVSAVSGASEEGRRSTLITGVPIESGMAAVAIPVRAGLRTSDYAMVSWPLTADPTHPVRSLSDDLGAYEVQRWRLFGWNAARQVFVDLGGDSGNGFPIVPGAGYFIISRDAGVATAEGTFPDTSSPIDRVLQPGWNLVGHPWDFPVDLADLEVDGNGFLSGGNTDVTQLMWGQDARGYGLRTVLQARQAYWILVTGSTAVTLRIPPISLTGSTKSTKVTPEMHAAAVALKPPVVASSAGRGGSSGGGGCLATSAQASPWMLILMLLGLTQLLRRKSRRNPS